MKKLTCLLTLLTLSTPSFAYDARHETYAGFRIHKNENIAFEYDVHGASDTTLRRDNFGIGGIIGNRLSDHVAIEFETSYTGAENSNFDYDVWANMFNMYLFQEFSDAIAPYAGLGIGFASIWGDIDMPGANFSDSTFDLSYQIMRGVNLALNDRVDINLGVKYQYYGEIEHKLHGNEYATTTVAATEFYFGGAYKFSLDEIF